MGMTPLTDVLSGDGTIAIVLSLLELAVDELSEGKGVQVYGHYDLVLAVVKMVLDKDLETKLLVSHMVKNLTVKALLRVDLIIMNFDHDIYLLAD